MTMQQPKPEPERLMLAGTIPCPVCEAPNRPDEPTCARCGSSMEEPEEEEDAEGGETTTEKTRLHPRTRRNPKERMRRRRAQMKQADWQVTIPISKMDEDQRLVFGWANMPHPVDKLGAPKIDLQNDQIFLSELEKAAYEYVEFSREGDEMHTEKVVAQLVESMVFTPEKMEKMGVEWSGPYGWWVGYRVDEDVFAKVKSGAYQMFSIGGTARPVEV